MALAEALLVLIFLSGIGYGVARMIERNHQGKLEAKVPVPALERAGEHFALTTALVTDVIELLHDRGGVYIEDDDLKNRLQSHVDRYTAIFGR